MGVTRLEGLTECGADGVAGAVAALLSELAAGQWRTRADFIAHFPFAICGAGRAHIPIGEAYCVELIIKFDIGMILIEFAGAKSGSRTGMTRRRAI